MKSSNAPLAIADHREFNYALTKQKRPKKTILANRGIDVLAEILKYRNNISAGTATPIAFTDPEIVAFHSLYDSTASDIADIKASVIKLYGGAGLCPYCQIDMHKDLDHFLPRSVFPEFSVSSQNLVPACSSCNTTHKKALWGNGPNRLFFHPYFDEIPNVQFIECDFSILSAKLYRISFKIGQNPNLPADLNSLLQRHFTTMCLNERYIAKATAEELPKLENLMSMKNTTAERVVDMTFFIEQQIIVNSMNSWNYAFYRALAGHIAEFCE